VDATLVTDRARGRRMQRGTGKSAVKHPVFAGTIRDIQRSPINATEKRMTEMMKVYKQSQKKSESAE
jgi:hypothetical protein